MCTGRVDLSYILRAFAKGADGVFIGGCWLGECHYVTEGNYDALGNVHLCRKLLARLGVNPARLRIEWIAASEGNRFAELMNDFVKQQRELGPLGTGEGIDEHDLSGRIAAAQRLVPYIKLVERERLRVPTKSEAAYTAFFASDEANRLFQEAIADKLAISQILQLLTARPLSTGAIAARLSLPPSAVARHLISASRRGWVSFDVDQNRYALAHGAVGLTGAVQESSHGH